MKKILFICNNMVYSDGTAITLRNLANEMSKQFEVHIFCLYRIDSEFVKGINDNITIHGFYRFYIKGLRSFTNVFLIRLLSKLKCIRSYDYDYIVSYQAGTPSVLTNYLKKSQHNNQAKYIGYIHGFRKDQLVYYRNMDAINSISEDGKNKALLELPNIPIVHIRNIYNINEIVSKAEENNLLLDKLPIAGKKIFLTVSRLSPEKGLERFVRSFSKARCQNSGIVAIIVGDGPSAQSIKNTIIECHAEEYIFMVGAQNNPYPFFARSDWFVCTSYNEGLCTSCVEASIIGIPILSTEVNGAHEIIDNPEVGIIVNNSEEALTEGIISIQTMEFNININEVRAKWDKQQIIKQYEDFFTLLGTGAS